MFLQWKSVCYLGDAGQQQRAGARTHICMRLMMHAHLLCMFDKMIIVCIDCGHQVCDRWNKPNLSNFCLALKKWKRSRIVFLFVVLDYQNTEVEKYDILLVLVCRGQTQSIWKWPLHIDWNLVIKDVVSLFFQQRLLSHCRKIPSVAFIPSWFWMKDFRLRWRLKVVLLTQFS